jgi:hypothetical protein
MTHTPSPKAGFRWSKQRESNFTGIQNPWLRERHTIQGSLSISGICSSKSLVFQSRPERAARTIAWPARPDCSPVGHRVGPPEFFVLERLLEEEGEQPRGIVHVAGRGESNFPRHPSRC